MPVLAVLEIIINPKIQGVMHEDNEAAYKVVKSGYSGTMRDLARLHGVSLASLHSIFYEKPMADSLSLEECDTEKQKADIFTKAFKTVDAWRKVLSKISLQKAWYAVLGRAAETPVREVCPNAETHPDGPESIRASPELCPAESNSRPTNAKGTVNG